MSALPSPVDALLSYGPAGILGASSLIAAAYLGKLWIDRSYVSTDPTGGGRRFSPEHMLALGVSTTVFLGCIVYLAITPPIHSDKVSDGSGQPQTAPATQSALPTSASQPPAGTTSAAAPAAAATDKPPGGLVPALPPTQPTQGKPRVSYVRESTAKGNFTTLRVHVDEVIYFYSACSAKDGRLPCDAKPSANLFCINQGFDGSIAQSIDALPHGHFAYDIRTGKVVTGAGDVLTSVSCQPTAPIVRSRNDKKQSTGAAGPRSFGNREAAPKSIKMIKGSYAWITMTGISPKIYHGLKYVYNGSTYDIYADCSMHGTTCTSDYNPNKFCAAVAAQAVENAGDILANVEAGEKPVSGKVFDPRQNIIIDWMPGMDKVADLTCP